jgi:hypothetical protein
MPPWITSELRDALERGGARHGEPDNACADHENLHGATLIRSSWPCHAAPMNAR